MKKLLFVLVGVIAIGATSCWHYPFHDSIILAGYSDQKTFPVTDFTEISASHNAHIEFCDTIQEIKVVTDANLINLLRVQQIGSKLEITYPNGVFWNGECETFVLIPTQNNISNITLSGASELILNRPITGANARIKLSGASELDAVLDVNDVKFSISGASELRLSGYANHINADISGASDFCTGALDDSHHFLLGTGSLDGSISGASSLFIHCDGTINCSISGSSIVHYTGNANTSGSSTSGASHIIHL